MMKKVLLVSGIFLFLIAGLYLTAVAQEYPFKGEAKQGQEIGLEKLQPEIGCERETGNSARSREIITSKIKQKTGQDKTIVKINKLTGTPHRIIGGGLSITPQDKQKMKGAIEKLKSVTKSTEERKTRKKGEGLLDTQKVLDETARNFIKNNQDILQADETNLKLLRIQKVRSKAYINYQQYYQNIPVYGAVVSVVLNEEGKIPSCGSDYHKDINISSTPTLTEVQAQEIAKQDAQFNPAEDKVIMDELLILPVNENDAYQYHLAYKLAVSKCSPPACWMYFIDAHTGEILVKYNNLKDDILSGNVTGQIFPEYNTDLSQTVPFRYEYVNIPNQSLNTTTDNSGKYTFSLAVGTYTLSVPLKGPWVRVITGTDTETIYTNSATVPETYNVNWDSSVATIAEMNVFYHVNKIYDYVKNTLRCDGMDWQMSAKVNKQNYANAYYSPVLKEIVFGDGGDKYENFALFSDVIYHEYTHAVTDVIYRQVGIDMLPSGEPGAIHEGLADYFACTINGDSVEGEGVLGNSARDLNNTLKYPNDIKYEVHKDGMIIGGVFWDLRANLIGLYGETKGKEIADELIHNARFGYPVTFSEYYLQILLSDDDDDSVFNGTPHSNQIIAAFQKHNISLPDCYCLIEFPINKSYVRDQISVIGIACSINPADFKSYELYCWGEDIKEKVFDSEYLLNSSTTPVSQTGLLGIWDTTDIDNYSNPKFKDDRYCLGVKIIKQNGEERVFYAHDIVVDNENSISEIEDLGETGAFSGEEMKFNIKFKLFDDPIGPYGGDVFSASNLPPNASFDPEAKLFTWTPSESDMGKTYEPVFSISDSQYTVSCRIKIRAVEAKKIRVYAYTKSVAKYNEKIVWIEKNILRGVEEVLVYDTNTGIKSILDSGSAEKDNVRIYENNVVWDEYCAGEYYVAYYDISGGIKRTDISRKLTYPPTVDIYGDIIVWKGKSIYKYGSEIYMHKISTGETTQISAQLSYPSDRSNPAIYENKIVWQDMRNGYYDIYMFDVSIREEKKIISAINHQTFPDIYENKIVWLDRRNAPLDNNNTYDIYVYDISTQEEKRITEKPLEIDGMSICGDKIAVRSYKKETDEWGEWLFFYSLYIYDISTGGKIQLVKEKEYVTKPFLCEKQIVWVDNINEFWGEWLRIVTLPEDFDIFNFSLQTGWSYLSLPIEPLDSNIEAILFPISGKYDQIKSCTQSRIYVGGSYIGDLTQLHAGQGVSILMTEPAILSVEGNNVGTVLPVINGGWNFLGLTSLESKPVSELMDINQVVQIYTLKPGSPDTSDANKLYYPANFTNFEPGKGYWIKKDTTPPTGTININYGAVYTTATYVALSLVAFDIDSQVTEMQIANDPNVGWAGPWPFAATRNWTLPWGNGTKTVYARFKDKAGNWSEPISDTIILDTSLPTTPVVTDGGVYTSSTTQLQVGWSGCSDPESNLAAGQYAIGTKLGGTDVKNWTQFMPPASANPFTVSGLTLTTGKTYYISLKFQNGAGLWSNPGCSDGIKVDTTAPSTPVVIDDGDTTTSQTQLHATWISSDAESGIAEYQYGIGTSKGVADIVTWTNTTATSITKTELTLTNGETYYFTVHAKNGAGQWNGPGYSDGITVNATATTETPWQTNQSGTLYTNIAWNYTMGYHFTPQEDGKITKLGGYFNGTKTVYLWNKTTGALLAQTTVTANNAWAYTGITPVSVIKGQTYTVAVYLNSSGASYRPGINLPQIYGNIKIESSTYVYGNSRPTNIITSTMYGQADIGFAAN
ncbi:MAG: hypothetical protein ABH836_00340 [Candidatus Omnitrophota bacterium]